MRKSEFYLAVCLLFQVSYANAQISTTEIELKSLSERAISFNKGIDQISVADFEALNLKNDIKVFGLGEANHGTKEFQILKMKLAAYLIEEKGVNTIILEYPYPEGLLLDQYVKGENINGLKILTDRKGHEYNNKEMIEFISFVKLLNEKRDNSNKINFLGADIHGKPVALGLLIKYFSKVDSINLKLLTKESSLAGNTNLSEDENKRLSTLSKEINSLLRNNKENYIQKNSAKEYSIAIRLSESLGYNWKGNGRITDFSENLLKTLNEDNQNKILVIGHVKHIGLLDKDIGSVLRTKLGNNYFSIGTDFVEGDFSLWNYKDPKKAVMDTLYAPTMPNSFASKFSNLPGEFHYISFAGLKTEENEWLKNKNYMAFTGMGFNQDLNPDEFRIPVVIPDFFDAVFIFKRIHPSSRY